MKLIADSGSTATNWAFVDTINNMFLFDTKGLNPFFNSKEEIIATLQNCADLKNIHTQVKKIYFYGSGCGSETGKLKILEGLQSVFTNSLIEVKSDLLGAARACYGNLPGLIGILGTGASVGFYNGEEISEYERSAGYILGDYGSGAYFGKVLLEKYLTNELPVELKKIFTDTFNINRQKIIHDLYSSTQPNAYLASFVPFLSTYKNNDFINDLISKGFNLLFKHELMRYQKHFNTGICFIGSVAKNFSDNLKITLYEQKLSINKIYSKPISYISNFHIRNF